MAKQIKYGEDARRAIEKGVNAFWNFAPIDLRYDPQQCTVVDVHLSDSLQMLSCKIEMERTR